MSGLTADECRAMGRVAYRRGRDLISLSGRSAKWWREGWLDEAREKQPSPNVEKLISIIAKDHP